MAIRIVRLGTKKTKGEGTRIGTVRRPPRGVLDLLAALSHDTNFSVGCYCENEARCHRSILRELLVERGARLD